MHIPSSMLQGAVCPITLAAGAAGVAGAAYLAGRTENKPSAAKFAGVTSLIFALQMLNFPVQNGTSGHLIGAVLAVALLGIPFAVLAMSIVLAVQAIFFGDGGINALGANIFNMGLLGAGFGGILFQSLKSKGLNQSVSLGVSSWAATMIAALACSIEIAAAGAVSLAKVIPAMLSVHALIGIGEAALTIGVVFLLNFSRQSDVQKEKRFALSAVSLAVIAALGSPLASSFPDGLEWAAEKLSFTEFSAMNFPALMPDYQAGFISHEGLSTIVAGLTGIVLAYGISLILGTWLKKPSVHTI